MTGPAAQALPRERAPSGYEQLNEQRYRQQVDDELLQKHDRRSHLRLGRGKFLVLSSPDGLEYSLGLGDDGRLTVTDYATGIAGQLVVDWDQVAGAAEIEQRIDALEAQFVDGDLSSYAKIAYVDNLVATSTGALAIRISDLEATIDTPGTGLSARVLSAESAIVDLDANKAEASYAQSIAAQALSLSPNLLPNPTGHLGVEGWTATGLSGFYVYDNPVWGRHFILDAGENWPGYGFITSDPIYVSAGTQYTFSADVFSLLASPGSLYLQVDYYAADHGNVGSYISGIPFGKDFSNDVSQRSQLVSTAPAGAVYARANLVGYLITGAIYNIAIRRMKFERGSIMTAYTEDAQGQKIQASVDIQASAIAYINGRMEANYAIKVDGGGNGAFFSLEDGTERLSAITLTADEIRMNGNVVLNGTLFTEAMALNAVTNSQVSQTAGPITIPNNTWTDVRSFSFTSVGIGVELRGTCTLNAQKSASGGSIGDLEWRLLRDSTVLKSGVAAAPLQQDNPPTIQFRRADIIADYNDIPSSGPYTYALQVRMNVTDGGVPALTGRVSINPYLSAREFKR